MAKPYQEEKGGTFESEGVRYDLNLILRRTSGMATRSFKVSSLRWILKSEILKSEEDERRVDGADLGTPILVCRIGRQDVVVDGVHRLAKAVREGRGEILGITVPEEVMDEAELGPGQLAEAAAPRMTPAKRKRIVDLILSVMGTLDKTGANRLRYQRDLAGRSDGQLEEMLEAMRADDSKHFYLEVTPFNNEPDISQIEAAAAMVGTKLHEYVYFRHDNPGGEPVRTRVRVPVGYMHVRRLQQILAKKTSYSTDASKRSQVTGQLVGDSAVGRLPNAESYALRAIGATATLKEFLGPRADNRDKRLGMYQAIAQSGFVSYDELVGDTRNQQGLNYLATIFLAAGLRSDLLGEGDLLRVTAEKPQ
jgi:hypothetical protein